MPDRSESAPTPLSLTRMARNGDRSQNGFKRGRQRRARAGIARLQRAAARRSGPQLHPERLLQLLEVASEGAHVSSQQRLLQQLETGVAHARLPLLRGGGRVCRRLAARRRLSCCQGARALAR